MYVIILVLLLNPATSFGPLILDTIKPSRCSGCLFGIPKHSISKTSRLALHCSNNINDIGEDAVLENEEPLSVIFQRGVVLQRSGDHEGALKEYKLFIKAAEGCGVDPKMFSEVHVNIGAVYFKNIENEELAKHHFELAINYRPVGTAYVNLALIALRKGSSVGASDSTIGMACLEEARSYLNKAIEIGDSEQSTTTAAKLLQDVDAIMSQMNNMR